MKIYHSPSRMVFIFCNFTFLVLTGLICVVPFVNLFAISFSSSGPVSAGTVIFSPVQFTLSSYEFAISNGKFFTALFVSLRRIVLGTAANLFL
jgi:putative aldouronate transport system permease protein